ncbi:MAG: FAD-binding oxidoreductase [Bacillaceae bacterium]|nr:FAD-binding oxidoreductase [Bacillaceae bacterium]
MSRSISLSVEDIKQKLLTVVAEEQIGVTPEAGKLGNSGKVIVYPENEQDVISVVKAASQNQLTVIPSGGSTRAGFGGTIEKADIEISLKKMRGIVEHSAGDLIMTVLPGTTLADIENHLTEKRQLLPLDAPWPDQSTIAGVIAANASGPKRVRYGSTRDLVIAMRVVYPDGTVIRTGAKVVKNVAGYDMNKLFIGSMGTLGVITEVTLKLRPRPLFESVMLVHSEQGIEPLAGLSREVLNSSIEPVSLELLTATLNRKLTGTACPALVVSFEDVEKSVRYQENRVAELAKAAGLSTQVLPSEEVQAWWSRFRQLPPRKNPEAVAVKIGVWLTDVATTLDDGLRLADQYQLEVAGHGSGGTGLVYFYISGVTEERVEAAVKWLEKMRRTVREKSGYAVVEHAPLSFRKKVDVWGDTGPSFRLMKGIKAKIDPQGILSPGRFLGGI